MSETGKHNARQNTSLAPGHPRPNPVRSRKVSPMKLALHILPAVAVLAFAGAAEAQSAADFECRNARHADGGLTILRSNDRSDEDGNDVTIEYNPGGMRLFGAPATALEHGSFSGFKYEEPVREHWLGATINGSFLEVVRIAETALGTNCQSSTPTACHIRPLTGHGQLMINAASNGVIYLRCDLRWASGGS